MKEESNKIVCDTGRWNDNFFRSLYIRSLCQIKSCECMCKCVKQKHVRVRVCVCLGTWVSECIGRLCSHSVQLSLFSMFIAVTYGFRTHESTKAPYRTHKRHSHRTRLTNSVCICYSVCDVRVHTCVYVMQCAHTCVHLSFFGYTVTMLAIVYRMRCQH